MVPDRGFAAAAGKFPEMKQASGILFAINEAAAIIEMAAAGRRQKLWVMTGRWAAKDDCRRCTPLPTVRPAARFTRFNVEDDRFRSCAWNTDDGGKSWKSGNHQVFKRTKQCRSSFHESGP